MKLALHLGSLTFFINPLPWILHLNFHASFFTFSFCRDPLTFSHHSFIIRPLTMVWTTSNILPELTVLFPFHLSINRSFKKKNPKKQKHPTESGINHFLNLRTSMSLILEPPYIKYSFYTDIQLEMAFALPLLQIRCSKRLILQEHFQVFLFSFFLSLHIKLLFENLKYSIPLF